MKKKNQSRRYINVLHEGYGFDDDGLEANVQGTLSEGQRQSIMWRVGFLGVLLLVLAILVAYITSIIDQSSAILVLLGSGFIMLYVLVTLIILAIEWRNNRVAFVEGIISLDAYNAGRRVYYRVDIANERLPLSKYQFLAFKNRDPYRIYYLPTSKRVMSAERLDLNE